MNRRDWITLTIISVVWVVSAVLVFKSTGDAAMLFMSVNAFAALTAAYVSVTNAYRATQIRADEIAFQKTENSFAFNHKWDSPVLSEARDFIREISQNRARYSEEAILSKIRNDAALERSVVNLHNFFSDIYLSIQNGRVNEDVLFQGFWNPYRIIHACFRVYMESDRKDYAFENQCLDDLHRRWSARDLSVRAPGQVARTAPGKRLSSA